MLSERFLTPVQAIMAAVRILGASFSLSRVVARYDLTVGMDDNGEAVLWRVNTISGDTEVCRTLGNLHRVKQPEVVALSHAWPSP